MIKAKRPEKSEVEKIIERIGGNSNEGAELKEGNCFKHGSQLSLEIYNEGGYNGTTLCLLCAKELIDALIKEQGYL